MYIYTNHNLYYKILSIWYILTLGNEISFYYLPPSHNIPYIHVFYNFTISSLDLLVRPDDGLIVKDRNMLSVLWHITS